MGLSVGFRSCLTLQCWHSLPLLLFRINNIPLLVDIISVYFPGLSPTACLALTCTLHVTRVWKSVSCLVRGLRVCSTCFQKRKEKEKEWEAEIKKKRQRERDGRGGRKRGRPREHNTTDDFEEQMIPLSCLLGFFFFFSKFQYWNYLEPEEK